MKQSNNHINTAMCESNGQFETNYIDVTVAIDARSADGVSPTTSTMELNPATDNSNDVEERMRHRAWSVMPVNVLPYRIVLGICITFVIMLFSMPIILFYAREDQDNVSTITLPSVPQGNLSTLCNITISDSCADNITNTYNALSSVSNPAFPFCIPQSWKLFCDALAHCNDDSYVKGTVCQEVRQDICTAEWRTLEALGRFEGLVNCDGYGRTAQLKCSDQFAVTKGGTLCLARCIEFSQHGESLTIALSVIIVVINAINVLGGFVILFISYRNRKRMYKFPQVLIVINAGIFISEGTIVLFSNIGFYGWDPICSDEFLPFALENPSAFCHIQGAWLYSVSITYNLNWFLFILHLFFKVVYPLDSKYVKIWQENTKVHIIEIALVFIIGTTPYIVMAATSQFIVTNFPPLFCGTNENLNFYTVILPTVLLCCVSLIMMLLVIYKIHLHFHGQSRKSKHRVVRFSTPEVKIFLIFCYLLVVMVTLWSSFSLETRSLGDLVSNINAYSQCLSGGIRKGLDCSEFRRKFEASSYPSLLIIYLLLISVLNLSTLPLVVEYRTVKDNIKKLTVRLSRSNLSTSKL